MTPELLARQHIDAQLTRSGWVVQDHRRMNLAAARGVAVREFPTDAGPADYLLFVDKRPVGVLEAKPEGTNLITVEAQTGTYSDALPDWLKAPVRPLPFLYEGTFAEVYPFCTYLWARAPACPWVRSASWASSTSAACSSSPCPPRSGPSWPSGCETRWWPGRRTGWACTGGARSDMCGCG